MPAGPPADNDTFWCPSFMNNCYSLYKTALAFPAAQTACAGRGGRLVTWNSYLEQVGSPCHSLVLCLLTRVPSLP
jgi:hypothetical protein